MVYVLKLFRVAAIFVCEARVKYKSNNELLDGVIRNLDKQNSLICVLFYDSRVFILSLNSLENVLC